LVRVVDVRFKQTGARYFTLAVVLTWCCVVGGYKHSSTICCHYCWGVWRWRL